MSRFVSLSALFLTLAALLMLMAGLQSFDFDIARQGFNPKSIAATGFIVLAAFTLGEFLKQFKAPGLLGYIVAGILFGPNLAELIPQIPEAILSTNVLGELALINILTVGVIGTLGGGELKIADLKENGKTIAVVIACIFLLVVPLTAGTVLVVAEYIPTIVPFLADVPFESRVAAALLFAVFGVAMSPTATLAILQETRASGKFTSLVLGVVIVGELELVLLVLVGISFAEVLLAPGGFVASAMVDALPAIAAEFGFALLIGIATGVIFILYLRFVAKEKLLFTVALIFGASYASQVFHAETLLVFLAAGFVVQNFSKHGHEMIHSLEQISLPVFVIYFMTQAAALDLKAVAGFAAFTVVLAVIRAMSIYASTQIATRVSKVDASVGRYLWLCFFSLGSVDLVLAAMVADAVPSWGTEFQTVIMACVVIHIIAGPPLLKLGLDRAGETEGSRQARESEAQSFGALDQIGDETETVGPDAFPEPRVEDEELRERLDDLRQFFVDLHQRLVARPFERRSRRLTSALGMLRSAVESGFGAIESIVASDEYGDGDAALEERDEAIRRAQSAYRSEVDSIMVIIEAIDPCPVTTGRLDTLLEEVRGREAFANVHRARRGDHLFKRSADDSRGVRLLKFMRRIRRVVAGPGTRSVPLGRLWRYYIELAVPMRLERAAEASSELNEEFWSQLGTHLRRVDQTFEDVRVILMHGEVPEEETEPDGTDGTLHPEPGEHSAPTEHADEEKDEPAAPRVLAATEDRQERAAKYLSERRERTLERQKDLSERLQVWTDTSLKLYTLSLCGSFADFLEAASVAGTLQLPSFKYRPSVRFDSARRAEQKLRDRLTKELSVVDGHRGWIILDHQIANFAGWFEAYETRVSDAMKDVLVVPMESQFKALEETLLRRPEAITPSEGDAEPGDPAAEEFIDWKKWLESEIRPQLRTTRNALERTQSYFSRGSGARRLLELLESRIHAFSRSLRLLEEDPESAGEADVHTLVLSPREWFTSEVARETALRFIELNERIQTLMRVSIDALTEVENVIDFNLLAAHAEAQTGQRAGANETALGGLTRAARMISEASEQKGQHANELRRWILGEMRTIVERATQPFFEHELDVIERKLSQGTFASFAAQGGTVLSRLARRAVTFGLGVWEDYVPVANETLRDLRRLLVEEPEAPGQAEVRGTLEPFEAPGELSVPMIYRRIFTPVPLDIPDFYVAREESEATLEVLVDEWRYGRPHTVLIHSDSGLGKRSFIHHVLQKMGGDDGSLGEIDLHTMRFDDDVSSVDDAVRALGNVLGTESTGFDDPVRAARSGERGKIVVIENAHKIFQRSAVGLEMCREVLRVIEATHEEVLWILLMNTAAFQWLDMTIDFAAYFTHIMELEGLSNEELQVVIQKRHRVSGFDIEFDRKSPSLIEVLSSPVKSARASRDPRAAFFRELGRLSKGSPLLALLYWLEAVHVAEDGSAKIIVGELPKKVIDLVEPLSLNKQLILAMLVQHGSLTIGQLRIILLRDFDEVQVDLNHLERLGYVESTGQTTGPYQLKPFAEALITPELRRRNRI